MRINNNVSALNAWRNLNTSNTQMGKSLEKLSSGFRINRAADDASGLVISQSLRAQISGLKQATRNAQDGISVVQTAEGALNEIHSMLNRMRDLAVQSANTGTMDTDAVAAAQAEFDELSSEIDRIAGSTSFGKQKLLDGTFGAGGTSGGSATRAVNTGTAITDFDFSDGAAAFTINGTNISLTTDLTDAAGVAAEIQSQLTAASITNVTAHAGSTTGTIELRGLADGTNNVVLAGAGLSAIGMTAGTATGTPASGGGGGTSGGATFQVGAYSEDVIGVSIAAVNAAGLSISGLSLSTAGTAIDALDAAITQVSTTRGELGAVQNRFESTINNLQVTTENLVASESRIRDVDMASEMTNFTKQQVLLQAGTAMLGQANSLSQSVLSLLQ